jgi:hypothetical protein
VGSEPVIAAWGAAGTAAAPRTNGSEAIDALIGDGSTQPPDNITPAAKKMMSHRLLGGNMANSFCSEEMMWAPKRCFSGAGRIDYKDRREKDRGTRSKALSPPQVVHFAQDSLFQSTFAI